MKMHKWLAGLAAASLVLSGNAAAAAPLSAGPEPVITLTAEGLTLEWYVPLPQTTQRPDGAVAVTIPGYDQISRPGQWQMPLASAIIALPPAGTPSLQVLADDTIAFYLPGPAARAGPGHSETIVDDAPLPPPGNIAQVTLEEIGILRGVRLARVIFHPIHSADSDWLFTTHISVAIHFNTTPSILSGQATAETDVILNTLQAAIVNPAQMQAAPPPAMRMTVAAAAITSPTVAIEVNTAGLTSISYAALAATGFPVTTTNPANLHLTQGGVEIATQWEDDGDATFELGEKLLFFALPRFSRWTTNDVYFLFAGTTPGLRMHGRDASPTGLSTGAARVQQIAETNSFYTPQCYCGTLPAGRDGDHWTGAEVFRLGQISSTFTVPPVDTTQPATATVWLIGNTDVSTTTVSHTVDHRVDVYLNSIQLGRLEWDGKLAITGTLPITPGRLATGANTLRLNLPGLTGINTESMWLDAFAIDYARGSGASGASAIFVGAPDRRAYTVTLTTTTNLRAYDITQASQPISLTGFITSGTSVSLGDPNDGAVHRYALATTPLTPAALRLAQPLAYSGGSDYAIITYADFIPALAPLIALRQSQGLTVTVETTQAVYDNFGDGRMDPEAIHAYLADMYARTPRPAYVLLVGDGTFDPRHYRVNSRNTYLPPYLQDVDPWMGETAADNRYVTVDGADALPDMAVGRLPVNSITETQAVVNKIVQYETNPPVGGWNGRTLFAADNGYFPTQQESLATTYITAPFTIQRAYLIPPATAAQLRPYIISQWSAGAGLVVYNGHSTHWYWADEKLLDMTDVSGLTNGRRLPVVLELTCFTGTFHDPDWDMLDETLVRHPTGGAVAVWGASGLGISAGHYNLGAGFLKSVYQDGQLHLGQATLAGKMQLAGAGQWPDMLDTFNLFGDPAMPMNLTLAPWPFSVYLPLVRR